MIRSSTMMNLILFLTIVAILFTAVGNGPYAYNPNNASEQTPGFGFGTPSPTHSLFSGNYSSGGATPESFSLYGWIQYLLIGTGVVAGLSVAAIFVLTGTFSFPNPYLYFAGFTLSLLSSLLPISQELFNKLPQPLGVIMVFGIGTMIAWSAINWWHTGENQ